MHRGLAYVGNWEDRTTRFASFTRLSRFILERGVSVYGPATIEATKRVVFPLKIYIYSKVYFLVSGILRRVTETPEGEEADPDQFLFKVDSKFTKETYGNIFERLILVDPLMRTFQSEEYVSENGYALYAPLEWWYLLTGLEGGYLKLSIVIYRLTCVRDVDQVNIRGESIGLTFEAVSSCFLLFYNYTCLKIKSWRRNKHNWLCGS
jgi:hypothetical protein